MKFKIITFGCKVNSYESESLKERLLEEGYQEAKKEEDADYFFVNTCAVTNEAEKKDLKKVRSLGRNYPNARIVIMGCSSQLHKERYTSLPQVDVVIGNSKKGMVEQCLESKTNDLVDLDSRHFHYEDTPTKFGEKNVRGYIKVQDGCDNFCSYCVVPFTRGNSRSRKKESILQEAKDLLASGIKELIIGGIDTGSYHDPEDKSYDLTHLLRDMLSLSNKPYRIRVSSIEASQISEEYIDLFASHQDILCPHFHMPLQSGSETILKKMNRKYTLEEFESKVNQIKAKIKDAAFSCDVITGFPGEGEKEFEDTYQFCKKIGFMRIHAFPYSERPFTAAGRMKDSIPVYLRQARVRELIKLSDENEKAYRKQLKGKEVTVLIEEKNKSGLYEGYSENYLRFDVSAEKSIVGQFYRLKID